MEMTTKHNPQLQEPIQVQTHPDKKDFFPSGAIAFFVALIIMCLVIWFGVYFLMIERI